MAMASLAPPAALSPPRSFPFVPRPLPLSVIAMNSPNKRKPEKISFGDQLLDYIEGGPKLRKWYGAPDQLPKDGGDKVVRGEPGEEHLQEENEVRNGVLVTDGDSMTGQIGALADKGLLKGIEHIVFLSQVAVYSNAGGLAALFNTNARRQAEEDEAAMRDLGIPCTIIRSAVLEDEPGGQKGFIFKEGSAGKGTISREDAAMICVKALDVPPKQVLIFEVANGEDQVNDWSAVLDSLDSCS